MTRTLVAKIGLKDLYSSKFAPFAIPAYEDAPYTTIENRAKVSRSLKAVIGVETIYVRSLSLLHDEFGPNGEQVWETDSKESRIRFVGSWSNSSTVYGTSAFVLAGTSDDYVEVTFWGTGLNLLDFNGVTRGFVASVDGGAEGASILPDTSTILSSRTYNPNIVYPVTSGLTLGWHTVKLRRSTSAWSSAIYGFQILNERSNLAVYPGSGMSNGKVSMLNAMATSELNEGIVGTNGARVIKYLKDGVLGTAVQEAEVSPSYLTGVSHTNEKKIRKVNYREFGINRADDFSTLSTVLSTRAFTLDDDVHTLIGFNVRQNTVITAYDSVRVENAANNFLTYTFVGTGLDAIMVPDAAGTPTNQVIVIDGVSYNFTPTFNSTAPVRVKICSGLPYGTHTIKFSQTAVSSVPYGIMDFISYQPKMPSLPSGAIIVAEYGYLANYVNPGNINLSGIPTGVIRKMVTREVTFSGTWAISAVNSLTASGFACTSSTASSYVEYVFWGTGVNYRFGNNAGAQAFTVSIDSSTNLSSFTTALSATAGLAFTAATGVVTGSPAASIGENNLSITGLSLGLHKIRISWTSGNVISPSAFDIVTPIYFNNPTMKPCSQSVGSLNTYSPKDLSGNGLDLKGAKAWIYYDQVNSRILGSYNVSSVVNTLAHQSCIYFEKTFKNASYVAVGMPAAAQIDEDTRYNNSCQVTSSNSAGSGQAGFINVAFFGELFDEE